MGQERNGNGSKVAIGRVALQLLVPALAAALAGYVTVASVPEQGEKRTRRRVLGVLLIPDDVVEVAALATAVHCRERPLDLGTTDIVSDDPTTSPGVAASVEGVQTVFRGGWAHPELFDPSAVWLAPAFLVLPAVELRHPYAPREPAPCPVDALCCNTPAIGRQHTNRPLSVACTNRYSRSGRPFHGHAARVAQPLRHGQASWEAVSIAKKQAAKG